MKTIALLCLTLSLSCAGLCQSYRIDRKLQRKLEALIKPFQGTVGIYVHKLGTHKEVAIRADSLFPTASMIKVAIQAAIFQRIADSQLQYHQNLLYRDSLYYPGVDILGMAKDSTQIELSKVVMLMITESDNTAALWLQSLAGGGIAINQWLADHGYQFYRVNSRTPGREAAYRQYGWGQTTPREMARFLVQLRKGKLISPAASERMYRNLCHIYWDDVALSQIPPYVQAASKQGAVDDSRSEVVLVNAPHGDYVFCVDTKNIADQSWTHDNAAWQLIREVSALLWHYFEPHDRWSPPPGYTRFMEE